MKEYCNLRLGSNEQTNFGHWHYAHFYYSQVQYREGGETWDAYRKKVHGKIVAEATSIDTPLGSGSFWNQGYIGAVYTTSLNLIVLQLDNACLPIYQR